MVGCFATIASKRGLSPAHASAAGAGASPHEPLSRPLKLMPCGTACSIAARTSRRLSGRSFAVRVVWTAIIPQPMSTPTAAGITAPTVGMTLPTVAPMPQWTSGITATHWWMNGIAATLRSWRSADSSTGTPRVHALMGTRPSSAITSYPRSVMAFHLC